MSSSPRKTSCLGPERIRVVSLVPSSTETLLALGADVVACTRFCEQPSLRHVGGTKNPEIDEIVGLAPDLVVLDREENRIEDHDALVAAGLNVFVSDVTTVQAGLAVVHQLGAAVGAPTQRSTLGIDGASVQRSAFVPIWRRPWMSISSATYGASLLAHLGIGLVQVDSEDAYPTVELAEIALAAPDLVLVPSEPYEFKPTHLGELHEALPTAEVIEIDGQDLFWWGSRTPSAVSRLQAALAPRSTR
jgi:ABC-type hemin transport system substrate-binding protein